MYSSNNEMLNRILSDLNVGWWKIDYAKRQMYFSDFAQEVLKINTDSLSFHDFIKRIRNDYREGFLHEKNNEDHIEKEKIFPLVYNNEEIWVCSKFIGTVNENNNNIATGYIQVIPNPEIISPEKGASLRLNNLLYQLNSVSEILLSFLKTDDHQTVINHILADILKQFKGGRAYIFEYDWEGDTQSCTYEIVDDNVNPEIGLLTNLPITHNSWWTNQLLSGNSIILSDIEDLPDEAHKAKELLRVQDIKSLIVIPLVSKNGVWGYVGIDIVDGHYNWTKGDQLWFHSIANIISIFIELHRSEKDAIQDKIQLQSLYENMPLAYIRMKILMDESGEPVDYIPLEINDATARLFKVSPQDYIGIKGSATRSDLSGEIKMFRKALQANSHYESQQWVTEINAFCNSVMYSISKDEVVCLFSDITESHKMHKELDRSEKILRNIYDNLPVGIELYDKDGILVDMNNSDVKMFGLTDKSEAIGLNLFNNPNIPGYAIKQLQSQQPVSFRISYSFDIIEGYYTSAKNGTIEIYVKAIPLYDSKGNLIHYLFINIDNTEINQAYSRIAEFENSFSVISKYGKIGYCKFDLLTGDGTAVPQWYYNLGEEVNTPINQVIGAYNHLHDNDRQKLLEHMRNVKAGKINGFTEDLRVLHEDNTWRWTQVNVLKNPANTNSSKLEMLSVNYDITNLKETEKKLIEAKEKAEVSDKLKSAFVANMSHEIRTPLNAIVGFSGLLADAEYLEEKATFVNIIQENNDMLLQLISDILDLSKIEAGTLDFTYGDVDVDTLCTEIIDTYRLKAEHTPVEILYDKRMPSCYINSDKNRLMQVIGNFMNNAMKFTSEGSITLGYHLEGDSKIRFFVQDTGTGIAENEISNIFRRFVKLNTFAQGTGLGLSICSSIVEQFGGEIGVTSTEGEGSYFWFTHPYVSTGKEKKVARVVESGTNSAPETEEIEAEEEKAVILVAEDTDSNFLLIKNIIKNKYAIIHARNGIEALELLENNPVNLILMDINMPEMDGITATRQIRGKGDKRPIIAATAYAFDGDKQKALEAGCTDYIAKPIKPKELLTIISKHLN